MELDIWGGDWGLPSVDYRCLQVMTLAKISGANLNINITNNPYKTPRGFLPVFRYGNTAIDEYEDIAAYLRRNNFNPDYGLSRRECSVIVAYNCMLENQLLPFVKYTWWLDAKNSVNLSRHWYFKSLPLPLKFYYPRKFEEEAKSFFEAKYGNLDLSLIEKNLYNEAKLCLNAFSVMLGDKAYLFSRPSSLDASLYACIAPIMKVPFPSPTFKKQIYSYSNLVDFVDRISELYFPECIASPKDKQDNPLAQDKDLDFPNKRRNKIIAGLFATFAMSAYAVSTGLFSVLSKRNHLRETEPLRIQDVFDRVEEELH